jgi:hypothetical protein
VLFLKESDDATKFETYLEMVCRNLLGLYIAPALPEKCQSYGQLTREINALQTPRVKYTNLLLPEDAVKLQTALDETKNRQYGLQRAKSDLRFGTFCKYSLGFFAIAMLFLMGQGQYDENGHSNDRGGLFLVFYFMSGLIPTLRIIWLMWSHSKIETQIKDLQPEIEDLEQRLKAFTEEAESVQVKNDCEWRKSLPEKVNLWQSIAFDALIKDYFDQGLWIKSGGFTPRLKAALTAVQKPFPTSCRVDVNKLQPNQITSAYQTFTELVATRMRTMDIMPGRNASARKAELLEALRSGPSAQAKPNVG